jgi:regulator of nucleoside diphosphate kinase
MPKERSNRRKPKVTISKNDFERLTNLALAIAVRRPDAADDLLAELDRARVVADGWIREDVVQMDSVVQYKTDTGSIRTITLVFPGDADISEGKVSVLTPIGTALLGLSTGQSMTWTARDGREHELTVITVGCAPSDRPREETYDRFYAAMAGA